MIEAGRGNFRGGSGFDLITVFLGVHILGKNSTISIVFRALNEEKFFESAILACKAQVLDDGLDLEIVLVDSGSTDKTLEIAHRHDLKIVHIPKEKFSFGRSLNWGCEAASGEYLAMISAHCIPSTDRWLQNLIQPLLDGSAVYSYGKQVGDDHNKFSEKQLFAKYFGERDLIQTESFFVNNANSCVTKEAWERHRFDEEVTGLEDMVLGKALINDGKAIAYCADATVIHIHEENWSQVRRRYYREALVVRKVLPEVNLGLVDAVRYTVAGILNDSSAALENKRFFSKFGEILAFRFTQYYGSYKGHNELRKLSRAQKEEYYYPVVERKSRKERAVSQTVEFASEKAIGS